LFSTLAILFATVFQLFFPAAVGSSFFNTVNAPIFVILIAIAGLCVVFGWQKPTWKDMAGRLLVPLILCFAVFVITIIAAGHLAAALVYAAAVFGIAATVAQWITEFIKRRNNKGTIENKKNIVNIEPSAKKNRYGAYIVHIGLALMAIGITGSSAFNTEKEATLKPGQTITINGYALVYDDISSSGTQSQMKVTARLNLFKNEKLVALLLPNKSINVNYEGQQTKVAIHSNLLEDVYVILNTWQADKTANFKVLINPLIDWIWIGGALIILGGVVCYWPQKEIDSSARQKNKGRKQ